MAVGSFQRIFLFGGLERETSPGGRGEIPLQNFRELMGYTLCFAVFLLQDVLVVLRDIQGSINSIASNGGSRLNSSASGSAGAKALPARASAVGKLRCGIFSNN